LLSGIEARYSQEQFLWPNYHFAKFGRLLWFGMAPGNSRRGFTRLWAQLIGKCSFHHSKVQAYGGHGDVRSGSAVIRKWSSTKIEEASAPQMA